jgi:L-threonylcarbamoyladenylate synthase
MDRTGGMADRGNLGRALAALRRGALIAFPTETFYALGVDPRKPAALERLRRAKGRERAKPILLIAATARQAFSLAKRPLPPCARALARRFWPGPLTLVLPPRFPDLARSLGSTRGVAVRVSSHPLARRLARALRFPITGTSANRSGEPPARRAFALAGSVRRRVDLVMEEGRRPSARAVRVSGVRPSTIVDLTRRPPVVLRSGAIAAARVQQLLAGPEARSHATVRGTRGARARKGRSPGLATARTRSGRR